MLTLWAFNSRAALSALLCDQNCMTVDDVVGMFIGRKGPAIPWREVLQQFNARSARPSQSRNSQMGAKHVIQMLLLSPVVLTFAGHAHPKQVVIELYTCVCVPHHNRSVIDAEEQSIA